MAADPGGDRDGRQQIYGDPVRSVTMFFKPAGVVGRSVVGPVVGPAALGAQQGRLDDDLGQFHHRLRLQGPQQSIRRGGCRGSSLSLSRGRQSADSS